VAKLTDRLKTMAGKKSTTAETDAAALLPDLSQAFAGVVARSELSRLLVSRVTEALGLREAALLLPRDEGSLALEESFGWAVDGCNVPELSRRGPIAGRLLQACRPLDSRELEGSIPPSSANEGERWWLARPEARLWVPLVRRGVYGRYILGKLQGLLILGSREIAPGFGREERRTIQALAFSAAVAAENVELVEALRAKAAEVNRLYAKVLSSREEERKRIARELHDGVVQDLIDLLYRLESGALSETSNERGFREKLRQVIDNTRRLCSELRPSALDDLDLPLAIQGYVEEVRGNFGLDVRLELGGDGDDRFEAVPEEARVSIFRVLQEGLMNVERHAAASRVEVELRADAGEMVLEVKDDGRGFDCPARLSSLVLEGRFGLAGAQERVSLLGGALEVESRPGRGTRLTARIPIHPVRESY
jgi:signal transduction histidine kinase